MAALSPHERIAPIASRTPLNQPLLPAPDVLRYSENILGAARRPKGTPAKWVSLVSSTMHGDSLLSPEAR